MTSKEIWEIIDWLDWETACKKENFKDKSTRPYDVLGKKLAEKYPEDILEIRKFVQGEKGKLRQFLTNYNIGSGNDSGWDLTSHIIGCGKDYIEDVKSKVKSGKLGMDNIYQDIEYVENFQYTFGVSLEFITEHLKISFEADGGKIGTPNRDELYIIWLRNRKIEKIIEIIE